MSDIVKVTTIQSRTPDDFNGLTRTWFEAEGYEKPIYMFSKPDNPINVKDELIGTVSQDKAGNLKFTKEKKPFIPAPPTQERTYRADPDKMKQEFTLEQARNMSIQRQVAVKGAVDLVVAGKAHDIMLAYVDLMTLLAEPDWYKFKMELGLQEQIEDPEIALDRAFDDLPPVENYEDLLP